jgi:hypothetical protein
MEPTSASARDRGSTLATAAMLYALVLAVVFTVVGVAGFFVTGFDNFAGHTDETLLGFEVNPLHNIVHLVLGLVGLVLWRTVNGALTYGYVLLVGYLAAFVYGLFAIDRSWDFLSINAADNWLHAVLALAGAVLVGLAHIARSETAPGDARTRFGAPRGRGHGAPA